ncbi:MAG: hypothetical protein ACI9LM_001126 [Alteromonadaceae bacterium]|jgi:hypothetical protein
MKILTPLYALLFLSVILSVLLSSCTSTSTDTSNNGQACDQGSIRLTTDFVTGRMDKCEQGNNNEYVITLVAEKTPINSSPWYAFKIVADQPARIKITMKVQGDKHRYPPKISEDGIHWQLQKYKLKNERLTMTINVSEQPTYIAAQEIINNQYYVDWAAGLTQKSEISHDVLGRSSQGRAIYKLESRGDSKEWLVILGRMHPPEVTGALALFPFVENLLSDQTLASAFRQKYNILIIPNINPDGVSAGNWRFNANNIDLNRDWVNFSQPEVRQIDDYLKTLVKEGNKIKFAVDFHSTREDVFYTMPTDYGMENRYFVKHWLDALEQKMPEFSVVTKPGNTPNNGVSKQYFADNFNVHAITYEMGDDTDRMKIKDIALNASNTLMQTLLSNDNHNITKSKISP